MILISYLKVKKSDFTVEEAIRIIYSLKKTMKLIPNFASLKYCIKKQNFVFKKLIFNDIQASQYHTCILSAKSVRSVGKIIQEEK